MTDIEITEARDYRVYIRRPRPTDQSYIASTWVNSLIQVRGNTKSEANALVDRMLDDPAVRLLLAVEPSSIDTILGWICYTPMPSSRIIHYVYVRDKLRLRGIASALYRKAWPVDKGKLVYTMRGPDSDRLLERWPSAISLPVTEFLGA
jgi:GNAT superfamily N-acetyltransferase